MPVSGLIPGAPILAQGIFDHPPPGYTVQEFFFSGDAKRYDLEGTAPFTTRFVLARPAAEAFSGTALAEWLNVSSGTDAAPGWAYLHREIIRSGHAYIGVSAQHAGLEGSASGIPGILPVKAADPARYASLSHPGDAFAFDIFTQCARAAAGVLNLPVQHILAIGESQSANFLTAYVNTADVEAQLFDGFLIHSRFRSVAPLDGSYTVSVQPSAPGHEDAPTLIRPDARVPVLIFITETDLMLPAIGYHPARQPDTARIRCWEVAGTAHADSYVILGAFIDTGNEPIEKLASAFTPTDSFFGQQLTRPINAAPQHHYVLQAALVALEAWVRAGTLPAAKPRLATHQDHFVTDACGNALGGVRSPWMDVPTARHSGLGQKPNGFAILFGTTEVFDAETLARLYPGGRLEYLRNFTAALNAAIAEGNILKADQQEILSLATAMWPGASPTALAQPPDPKSLPRPA